MSVELVNGHVLLATPPNWRQRPSWSRTWQTEVVDAVTGAEDRGALRQVPRIQLSWLVTPLGLAQQQRFEDTLREAVRTGQTAVPYWGAGSVLASAASSGGSGVTVASPFWPFELDDWIILIDLTDPENPVHNVRQVTGTIGSTHSLSSVLTHTFPAGSLVWPLLFGKLAAGDWGQVTNHRGDHRLTLTEITGSFRVGGSTFTEYLGRPILESQINWADRVNRSVHYDLRELAVGFGAEVFGALQDHVVHGFQITLDLNGFTAIWAQDDLTAALKGRLKGFWLPSPQAAFGIAAGEDATHFDITEQGLADTLEDHPARYVRFTKAGQTAKHAKVTAVTDNGDGTERVTVDASVTVDETWEAHWLHYVRLAADEEQATLLAEQYQKRQLRLVELPTEYAAFETGEEPVYLYHFWMGAPVNVHWYFTSFGADLVSNSQTYTAKPVTHGEISQGIQGETESLNLEAVWESGHPLAIGFPHPSAVLMNVEVKETTFSDPDTTITLFTGVVESTPRRGLKIKARAISVVDLDNRRILGALIGPRCSHQLYEAATCKVSKATFQKTGCVIDSISSNGRTIRVSHATALNGLAAQWFTFGWIETGSGADYEQRTVIQDTVVSGTERDLVLSLPLVNASVSDSITLVPGCDGKWATCQTKFSNDNFSGHPFVPVKNPTLIAIPVSTSQGGKK